MPEKKKRRLYGNKTKGGLSSSIRERRIVISGIISNATMIFCESALKKFAKEGVKKPIVVFVTGPGGDFYACLRIYHLLCSWSILHAPVFTVGFGNFARSGAFLITQAGFVRLVSSKTALRFHRATRDYPEGVTFNSKRHMEEKDLLDIIDGTQCHIFSCRGRPASKIYELFIREKNLSAKQALNLYLVDMVLKGTSIASLQSQISQIMKEVNG